MAPVIWSRTVISHINNRPTYVSVISLLSKGIIVSAMAPSVMRLLWRVVRLGLRQLPGRDRPGGSLSSVPLPDSPLLQPTYFGGCRFALGGRWLAWVRARVQGIVSRRNLCYHVWCNQKAGKGGPSMTDISQRNHSLQRCCGSGQENLEAVSTLLE